MKTNFTYLKCVVLSLIVLSLSLQSKADNHGIQLNFNSTPAQLPNTGAYLSIGSKYKFGNVASGTDAIVTIVSATGGATVAVLDDNTTTKPEAFSPQINVPKFSTGMVQFKIEFVNGGGNPVAIDTLRATAMDIDGNTTLHELDALDMGPTSLLSYLTGTLDINVLLTGTQYLATNIAGIEYSGVDTSAKSAMFTLTKANISSFTYSAGAINLDNQAVTRQKGIYFKSFNYVAAANTLPVKYSAFGATAVDKAVVLKWTTEQEINNSHFEVERSFDGTNFKAIAIVLDGFANGNQTNYQYKDNSTDLQSKTVVYYRLKQVDNNGTFSYTNTLVVKLKATEGLVMQTSPNPFTQNLNVRFTAAYNGSAQIDVLGTNGQTVLSKQVEVSKGYVTIQLDGLSKLAPGMYIARLTMNGVIAGTQKIVKN